MYFPFRLKLRSTVPFTVVFLKPVEIFRRKSRDELIEIRLFGMQTEIHIISVAEEIQSAGKRKSKLVHLQIILLKNQGQGLGVDPGDQIGINGFTVM